MRQADWNAIGILVAVSLVFYVVLMTLVLRRAARRSPRGIAKRLRRPADRVVVKIAGTAAIWDPGRPLGPDNGRWGPARATYTRDESGTVHLHFQPALADAEDSSGPIPDFPARPRAVWLVLGGYLVGTVAGFVVGFAVGHGPGGERLLWGVGGIAAAMLVLWLLSLVLNVGKAVRDTTRPRTPAEW